MEYTEASLEAWCSVQVFLNQIQKLFLCLVLVLKTPRCWIWVNELNCNLVQNTNPACWTEEWQTLQHFLSFFVCFSFQECALNTAGPCLACRVCKINYTSQSAPLSDDVQRKVADDINGPGVKATHVQHAPVIWVGNRQAVGRHSTHNQLGKHTSFLMRRNTNKYRSHHSVVIVMPILGIIADLLYGKKWTALHIHNWADKYTPSTENTLLY